MSKRVERVIGSHGSKDNQMIRGGMIAPICIELGDKQCHWSNVTERRKRCPSRDSNHVPSAIRADVLSQLD